MARILKGAPVAAAINEKAAAEAAELRARGISPTLAILRVGSRADDISYEKNAAKRCALVGIDVKSVVLPDNISQRELMAELEKLNRDSSVHGIIYFRPLPSHLNDEELRCTLLPEKDVDGITDISLAGVFSGSDVGFSPCTAQACMELLDYYGIEPAGRRAAVLGRSLVVGKPAAMMLINRSATVAVCHSQTENAEAVTSCADIVIAAVGKAETIGRAYFSAGQTVIDVGTNWSIEKGRLCGDVCFDAVEPIVDAISPVPGGVGTVTTSVLAAHVIEAARRQAGL